MNSVEVDFEGIKVNTFACYDEYLTNLYGDYMKLPPKSKQIGHHYSSGYDMNISYKDYIKSKKK